MIKLICALLIVLSPSLFAQKFVLKVPVSDLRIKPVEALGNLDHDPLQDSQALLGDCFEQNGSEENEFIKVNALNQINFGVPLNAWIKKEDLQEVKEFPTYNLTVIKPWTYILATVAPNAGKKNGAYLLPVSLGTNLEGVKEYDRYKVKLPNGHNGYIMVSDVEELKEKSVEEIRKNILKIGSMLIGNPYYWGGASAYHIEGWDGPQTGVDCSGLVYILYKSQGIQVPRDSRPQQAFAKKVYTLEPGDLVFLADADNKKVHHVMIYAGGEMLLEAHQTGSFIRLISFEERIGKPLSQLFDSDVVGNSIVYFGSFLNK